jgi:hypothetical protein
MGYSKLRGPKALSILFNGLLTLLSKQCNYFECQSF